MEFQFEVTRTTRTNILREIEGLSMAQLNHIPTGFNNNIIWNLGHLIATQQLLIYGLSATPFVVPKTFIDAYRKGTKPSLMVSEAEIEDYKAWFLSTIDQMQADYENQKFGKTYTTYTTSYNFTLTDLETGITFNNVHEALHYGMIKALLKFV